MTMLILGESFCSARIDIPVTFKCQCGILSGILWISFAVAKVDVVHPVFTSVLKKDMFSVQYAPTTIR
jgi:hypothetical protein